VLAGGRAFRLLLPAVALGFLGFACSGLEQPTPRPIPDNEARPPFDSAATWSPDGTRVAFTRGAGETLRVFHLPSRLLTTVSEGVLHGGSVLWATDGRRFAYVRSSDDTLHVFDVLTGRNRELLDGVHGLGKGAWSPDGRLLAVASVRDRVRAKRCFGVDSACSELYLVALSGAEPRRLTDNLTYEENPTWSLDGQRLAVLSGHEPDDGLRHWRDVRVVSVRDGVDPLVTNDGRVERTLEWTGPNTLAIELDDRSRFELSLGSGRRRTLEPAPDDEPYGVRSSLDGTFAYGPIHDRNGRTCWEGSGTSDGPGCYPNAELYLRRPDGSRVRVTHSKVDETGYAWSPDGRVLAFESGGTLMLVDHDGSDLRRLLPRG
jgi:dipeptidyl aminopeptidase/acylaminoacyl peptidase